MYFFIQKKFDFIFIYLKTALYFKTRTGTQEKFLFPLEMIAKVFVKEIQNGIGSTPQTTVVPVLT
jgi:hypothetical protein